MRSYDDRDDCYSRILDAMSESHSDVPGEQEYAIAHLIYFGAMLGDKTWLSDNLRFEKYVYELYERSADQNYEPAREFLFRSYTRILVDEWSRQHSGMTLPTAVLSDRELLPVAVDWMFEQAEIGRADAQYAAGYIYEYGLGRESNLVLAKIWYSRAAAANHESAQERLSKLAANNAKSP